jgi:hypothetical protein
LRDLLNPQRLRRARLLIGQHHKRLEGVFGLMRDHLPELTSKTEPDMNEIMSFRIKGET